MVVTVFGNPIPVGKVHGKPESRGSLRVLIRATFQGMEPGRDRDAVK